MDTLDKAFDALFLGETRNGLVSSPANLPSFLWVFHSYSVPWLLPSADASPSPFT